MRSENLLCGQERKIAEVLMIDRIELILLHQPHQMRKLDSDDTTRPQQDLHPCDKVVEIGHLGEHVVSEQQIGALALGNQVTRSTRPEEFDEGGHALLNSHWGNICCWLDPEHRDLFLNEILKEIT